MKIISAPRYAGKTTRAVALVKRLNDIEGNKAILVTISLKEGDKLYTQHGLKHRPVSIQQMLNRRGLRGYGITHAVIDGLDHWLHCHLADPGITLAGITINEDE